MVPWLVIPVHREKGVYGCVDVGSAAFHGWTGVWGGLFDYSSCCVALCGGLTGLPKRDLKVLGVADDLEERM